MKRSHLIAVLVGVMAIVAFANNALAYYHPGMGRFTSRDPGPARVGSGGMASGGQFAPRDQYVDGMNLYQYVKSNPIRGRDPLGLFESSEADQIGSLDDVIKAAENISSDKSFLALMRWGRFVAAMGGAGAWEAMADPNSGSTASTPYPRYIYTCRCGMIDLRHFYQLMYIANLKGNAAAIQMGIDHEEGAEAASRYAPEDITSNALGAYFGSQQSWVQRRSVFINNLKQFLSQCDPVDWSKLTDAQKTCIINYYAVDKDGDKNRRKTAGSDGDCCGVCKGKNSSFPFATDPKNPAMITGPAQ